MKDFSEFIAYYNSFAIEAAEKTMKIVKDDLSDRPNADDTLIYATIVKVNTIIALDLLEKYHEWLHEQPAQLG